MKPQNQSVEMHSERETEAFARKFAKELIKGDIILLYGDLGMGKTVFCRALIKALCESDKIEVPSPTFTLLQSYDSPRGIIWHFDLYRLSDPLEIYEIGWEEALIDGIILVEWPQRLGNMIPSGAIKIKLSAHDNHSEKRTIEIVKHE